MAQAYFSLVTTTGKIKIAESAAGGDEVVITHFAIGDGNGAETNPTAASTALVREVWRTQIESVITDPDNPSAILVTAIIPTNAGGWWMREFGIFDQAGSMIAVAKPVSQYKPTALEGQLEDIRYEFQIIIGENANVTLLVDPSLLFATRAWVENRKIPMGQLMRLPWLPVISMTLSSAPGNPAVGDSYLVPSNATGIWAANIGKLAEWNGSNWNYIDPPNGHGISLPDGRVFERIAGAYVEKLALDTQSGKWSYALAGGTANALTATLSPAPAALTPGMTIRLKIASTNTAAATLSVNGLGPVSIRKADISASEARDLVKDAIVDFIFDGTFWQIAGAYVSAMPARRFQRYDKGSHTFVVPEGVFWVHVRAWGAGGGGGGHTGAASGAGGGGGGYSEGWVPVVPGASYAITVGAGGSGGNGAANGQSGGTSSFGAFLSATGGGGGGYSTSGAGLGYGSFGTGVGGQLNLGGISGGYGLFTAGLYWGGTGGGAFATPTQVPTIQVAGLNGNYPAGGGNGGSGAGGSSFGGSGSDGIVIVSY
ncbi:phage tail protein [Agrobacterium tumefaciens]|uniref:phage tail-collar fiber domain-containing protein n=1 Tax=Agrobacterium tumefaciens TaxID=358 RepID=UPI0021D26FD0|nr:phage tail protein [Agrobacterium tumefaciens]UXT99458.1 DUF2793 domain-containing protein [Agrobacterium tumefaciens]